MTMLLNGMDFKELKFNQNGMWIEIVPFGSPIILY